MRTIKRDIVGGFVFSADAHMLLVKSSKGGVYQGFWLVPGGGVEPGETKHQALARELLEEVNLDVSDAKITLIRDDNSGESEKDLPETGERVLVRMRFHDYKVLIPKNAADIPIQINHELAESMWIPVADLPAARLVEPTMQTLQAMGYL